MSEDKKVIINCDHFGVGVVGRVIICAPTNIICTVQAGGIACRHPGAEGFPMDVRAWEEEIFYKALNEFDDCKWGCWCFPEEFETKEEHEHLEKYAREIDKFLSKNLSGTNCSIEGMAFEFDHERIKELMEGWWPVLVRFKNEEFYYDTKFKGYLYFGNCD